MAAECLYLKRAKAEMEMEMGEGRPGCFRKGAAPLRGDVTSPSRVRVVQCTRAYVPCACTAPLIIVLDARLSTLSLLAVLCLYEA
eukprot:COSAG02_NODE_2403_length_8936_cov_7.795519_10_plen_85_part_00